MLRLLEPWISESCSRTCSCTHPPPWCLPTRAKLTFVLPSLNAEATVSKRTTTTAPLDPRAETCLDPFLSPLATREIATYAHTHGGHHRRQTTAELTQGYVTTDAFGTDGDDTAHTALPRYSYPDFFQGLGGFPANGSLPEVVDLIFIDYIAVDILAYLATVPELLQRVYSEADVAYYIDDTFSTQTYLPKYVGMAAEFQQNLDNCTIY